MYLKFISNIRFSLDYVIIKISNFWNDKEARYGNRKDVLYLYISKEVRLFVCLFLYLFVCLYGLYAPKREEIAW